MSNLDWKKHDKDISTFVRKLTDFYLRTEASTGELLPPDKGILLRNNYATPLNISLLLAYLKRVSGQVDSKLDEVRGVCVAAEMDLETCKAGSSTYGPVMTDYERWYVRLDDYERLTQDAIQRNPEASGDEDREFWDNVTKPLLLGLYPGVDQQTRLDAVTPLILAWQIEVYERAYVDARKQFWVDVKESAGRAVEGLANYGGLAVLLVLGVAAFGYGVSR